MTLPLRLLEKVRYDSGCWIWTAAKNPDGYGICAGPLVDGHKKLASAHKVFFEVLSRPIPAGLELDHKCRNRACVNPAHLEPVTRKVNILRGIGPSAVNARKTHCNSGHAFTPENTRLTQREGHRRCKRCETDGQRRRRTNGGVAERSIAPDSRSGDVKASEGSIPSPASIRFATVGASW